MSDKVLGRRGNGAEELMHEAEISKLCIDGSTFFVIVKAHQQHLHRYDEPKGPN